MCDPATITLISTLTMSGMQMMSSVQGIKAQNERAEAQSKSANLAASYDYQQLATKSLETDEQAAQDKLQRQLQAKREHSTIAVAMGEAGVTGNSSLRVLNNSLMQSSYDVGVIEANRLSKQRQIRGEVDTTQAKNISRHEEAESQTISPGLGAMSTILTGVEGGMTGYTFGSSLTGFKGSLFKGKTVK